MNVLKRHIDKQILNHFNKYKQVLILLGARQVGKTTLLQRLFPKAQFFLLDNEPVRRALEKYDINVYKQIINPNIKVVVLDEIHLLSNPGRAAKIIYDQMPNLRLILTGSSSLNIKNKTSESLAGRKVDYHLFPLTFSEYLYQKRIENELKFNIIERIIAGKLNKETYLFDMEETLENILNFGLYPYLIDKAKDATYITNLADSVIFKDILELDLIDNKRSALNLLKLLAHQIGNLVNYSEIADRLSLDARTVKRYIEIFEQSFIIFRLYPFSQRKRSEIGKTPKVFFYDTGLRNALIEDFSPLLTRDDRGALFENFIISEILKINTYAKFGYKLNYWRTKQGAEVDLILSRKDELTAVEIKYVRGSVSKAFKNRYPQANLRLLTSMNFW
jgi:predicted AAA+ superfamily ATPase